MPRKPRGTDGWLKVSNGGIPPEFLQNPLPDSKPDLERAICAGARRGQEFQKLNPWRIEKEPRQLEENSLDFELETPSGVEYLDLVEFAPLTGRKGGYEGLPKTQQVGQLTDAVIRLVDQKANRYGPNRRAVVHLLLYSTDFRLHLNPTVVLLLKVVMRRDCHGFRTISHYVPIDEVAGEYTLLYPSPGGVPYVNQSAERDLRARTWTNLDMREFRSTDDGQGAFIELPKG